MNRWLLPFLLVSLGLSTGCDDKADESDDDDGITLSTTTSTTGGTTTSTTGGTTTTSTTGGTTTTSTTGGTTTITTTNPVDADGDGFTEDEDCDDTSADVNPDAEEICNGRDDDCDEETDEGVTVTAYTDRDADGYGDDRAGAYQICEGVVGYATEGGDCDDGDDRINPDAWEVCDDFVDNNCNGVTDTDCSDLSSYTTWEGEREYVIDAGPHGTCDIIWRTEGAPSSESCGLCDFVFEVDAYDGTDYGGACGNQDDWIGMVFGYTADYYGYGEFMLYQSGGTFYIAFYANLLANELEYYHTWVGDYGFDYGWYGSATLSP